MKYRAFLAGAAIGAALATMPVAAAPQQLTLEQANAIARTLKPQHGNIAIAQAHASLDLGEAYDFYSPDDARKILVDIWGNPPEVADGVLGMVIPAGVSPLSNTWGAILSYENSGYVADDDAASTDYNEILGQLKQATEDANEHRKEQGYPVMHLQGWAEAPRYDTATHSVVWARDIAVDGDRVRTLNYDERTLGRNGVLSVNFLSTMPELGSIRTAANAFASHAHFDNGFRYQDFDPNIDKKAEYGVGGLIIAGVGLAAAKKLGFLAVMAKFAKPIIIGILAAFAALRKRIGALFTRSKDTLEG